MFSFLTPKILGCTAAGISVPVVGGVVYATWPEEAHTILLVSSESTSTDLATEELKFGDEKNFKCKFNNKVDENCTIEAFAVDTTKKWADLSKLNEVPATQTAVTKDTIKVANNLFKVTVSSDILSSIDWKTNTHKLEIVPNAKNTTTGDASKKYASLTPLMSFSSKSGKAQNKLFLGKASELFGDSSGTLSSFNSTNHKCVLGDADINVEANRKGCKINTFATTQNNPSDTSTFSDLTFTGTTSTEATSIKKNEFYLVEFTDALTDDEVSGKDVFYVATTTSPAKKVKFTSIKQAVLTGADGSKNLLIIA